MPLKTITKSQHPEWVPFMKWYESKIQEFTAENDQANLTKFQSAMEEKNQAAAAAGFQARDFYVGAVEIEGLSSIADIPSPQVAAFDEIYQMWVDAYNVEITIEEI